MVTKRKKPLSLGNTKKSGDLIRFYLNLLNPEWSRWDHQLLVALLAPLLAVLAVQMSEIGLG